MTELTREVTPFAPAGLARDLEDRHARLRAGMARLGASCLVAIREQTVTYLTGYTTMTWKLDSRPVVAVLTADGRLLIVAAETEVDSAKLRIPGADVRAYVEIEAVTGDMHLPDGKIQFVPHAARVLAEAIEDAGEGRVAVDGLDAPWPPIGQLTRMVPGLGSRTVDASALVWGERLRKTEWELERMREASRVLEGAYRRVRDKIRPGMTERDIAREFSIAQLEAGAHEVGPFAVVAGVDRGLFGFPTDSVWNVEDLLYLDGAAIVDGYWADYCRTFAGRDVTASEQAGYARAREALDAGVDAARAGLTAGELGTSIAAAMDIAPSDVGFGRFGHGLGLNVEPPSLHRDDATVLEDGFAVCIEPAVEHEGSNIVVEEEHAVTADGVERLSPEAPREILRV
jgi:Xaa-Pro aminopeptidase